MTNTITYNLSAGPLLSTIAPGQTTTLITTTSSGLVKAIKPICNLHQTVIHISQNPQSSTLLIIGTLRKAIFLIPDNETLKQQCVLIPGNTRFKPSSILVTYNTNGITILDRNLRQTIFLDYPFLSVPPANPLQLPLLLRAVDDLSYHADVLDTFSRQTDALIASFNTFLCTPPVISLPVLKTLPTSTILSTPPPITGNTVFLEITATSVPKHCFIRCTITKLLKSTSALQHHPNTSLTTIITQPLNNIVSFPFVLSSHSPIRISLHLLFQHIEKHVSTTTLDILDFSRPIQQPIEDTSHHILAGITINKLHKPTITTLPLHLPLPPTALNLQTGFFQTSLNGIYKLSITGNHNSIITIQAPYHIAAFVRAALLRRVLKTDMQPTKIHGAIAIRNWKSHVVDTLHQCHPSFRTAETALVNVKQIFQRVQQGFIEECYDQREQIAYRDAVLAVRASYAMLRRQLQNLWTP